MSLALMDSELSQRAYKLVKKAGQLIDDTWTKNKKKSLCNIKNMGVNIDKNEYFEIKLSNSAHPEIFDRK